jgi:hypothetical protein
LPSSIITKAGGAIKAARIAEGTEAFAAIGKPAAADVVTGEVKVGKLAAGSNVAGLIVGDIREGEELVVQLAHAHDITSKLGIASNPELIHLVDFTEIVLKSPRASGSPLTTLSKIEVVKDIADGKWMSVFEHGFDPELLMLNPKLLEKLRRDLKIPEEWAVSVSKDGGGLHFFDVGKNKADSIRVMPGNPRSPHPISRRPYVRQQKEGRVVNASGEALLTKYGDDAHMPLDTYSIPNFWKK